MSERGARIVSAFVLVGTLAWTVSSESLTVTAYYPSPAGIYRRLITNELVANPQTEEPDPKKAPDGMLYFQKETVNEKQGLKLHTKDGWKRVAVFRETSFPPKAQDKTITLTSYDAWREIVDLPVKVNDRGLYNISWSATVNAPKGAKTKIRLIYFKYSSKNNGWCGNKPSSKDNPYLRKVSHHTFEDVDAGEFEGEATLGLTADSCPHFRIEASLVKPTGPLLNPIPTATVSSATLSLTQEVGL